MQLIGFSNISIKQFTQVMNNKHIGIHNSVFRVGVVYSVNGREVKIRVDHNKNSSHLIYKGVLIKKCFSRKLCKNSQRIHSDYWKSRIRIY